MIIPVGDRSLQQLFVVERTQEGFSVRKHCPVRFVDLRGRHGWEPGPGPQGGLA